MTPCAFCGQAVEFVYVHGHYQCTACKTNTMPCCDSDNCDTNVLFRNNEEPKAQQRSPFGQTSPKESFRTNIKPFQRSHSTN